MDTVLPRNTVTRIRRVIAGLGVDPSIGRLVFVTALVQLCSIASTAIIARIYSHEAIGDFQIYASALGMASVVVNLKLDAAIVVPKEDRTAIGVVHGAILASLAMTVAVFLVCYLFLTGSNLYENQESAIVRAGAIAVGSMLAGLSQALGMWALRRHAYQTVANGKKHQALAQIVVQLGAGVVSVASCTFLIAGDIIGRIFGSIQLLRRFRNDTLEAHHPWTVRGAWSHIKLFKEYPLVSAWSSFLNNAGLQIPPLLLARVYGKSVTASYALAVLALQAPSVLFGQAISQVYIARLSASIRERDGQASQKLVRLVVTSVLVGGTGVLILLRYGAVMFVAILGSSWAESGEFVAILSPSFLLCFIHQCIGSTLLVCERQWVQARWDVTRLALVCGGVFLGEFYALNARNMVLVLSVVNGTMYAIHIALCFAALAATRPPNSLGREL